MASLQELTERVRTGVGDDSGLGKSVKFDLKGEGFIHIDGGVVSNDDKPADLTITISQNDMKAMGKRQLDPMTAVMKGRMRLSDMGLAMSLQPQVQQLFSRMVADHG